MTHQLAASVIADIKQKIETGEINGNTDKMLLYLLSDVHTQVLELTENPAVVVGRILKKYPAMAWPAVLVSWVLAGGATAIIVIRALAVFGLQIVRAP